MPLYILSLLIFLNSLHGLRLRFGVLLNYCIPWRIREDPLRAFFIVSSIGLHAAVVACFLAAAYVAAWLLLCYLTSCFFENVLPSQLRLVILFNYIIVICCLLSFVDHEICCIWVKLQFSDIGHLTHDQAIFYCQFASCRWLHQSGVDEVFPKLLHFPSVSV